MRNVITVHHRLRSGSGGSAAIETPRPPRRQERIQRQRLVKNDRPELTAAKIIVSGARHGSSEKFNEVDDAAGRHRWRAIGASRAAVDRGLRTERPTSRPDRQDRVPQLYIAAGIRVPFQHLAGMKDSR